MTFLLPCLAVFQSCEMKKLNPRRFTVLPFSFVFSNRGHRRLHLLRKWIVSIEQYVLRSVLVRNSAISYSDSRERHFMIKTYEKGLGLFWLFKGTCDSRCLYLVIFIIGMPSINSNFSRNPSNVIFSPYFIFSH